MSTVLTEAARARRVRAEQRPARVTAPLAGGASFVVTVIAGGLLLEVPVALLVVLAVAATVVSAFLARRTLTSLAAGAGLHVARAVEPGDVVRVYVASLGRVVVAEVVRVGAANTTLRYRSNLLVVPNGSLLRRPPETSTQA